MKLYSQKLHDGSFEIIQASSAKSGYDLLPEQYTLADAPYITVIEIDTIENERPVTKRQYNLDAAAKNAAEGARTKAKQVKDAYNLMNAEILAEMEKVFETSNSDAANAEYSTYKDMAENPAAYAGLGLKVQVQIMNADDTELFDEGAALDTDAKVQAYANRKIELAKAFGVYRMQRIQQFYQEKETIEGA
jgi:hypothetical protein